MRACHKLLKFLHSVGHTFSQIGIHIIVVLYGVGRSGFALDNMGIVRRQYPVVAIVCLCRVFNDTCVPYVRHTKFLYRLENAFGDLIHFSTPVLRDCPVRDARRIAVGEQTGEKLIDDWFAVHTMVCFFFRAASAGLTNPESSKAETVLS